MWTNRNRKRHHDDELLNEMGRAFQGGDRTSFRTLVETCSRKLMAMAYRYLGDWETARDMTQETWIKVYERIDAYDPAQPFQSWLLAIHRNHCLSHLRRASVRRETAVGDMAILELRPIEGHDAPLEILQRQEFAQRLRQAMAGLTASQQRVFGQVDLEQTEQKEAARILGMNAATLRSTLHAARKRLAGILVRMEATP